jgi:hypothetical protein
MLYGAYRQQYELHKNSLQKQENFSMANSILGNNSNGS